MAHRLKNAGKTGLMERLTEFAARGHSVSTLKHAHHSFDVDHAGRDSHRIGAAQVLLSWARAALMSELRGADEPPMDALLTRLDPVDLVLVEAVPQSSQGRSLASRAATPDRARRSHHPRRGCGACRHRRPPFFDRRHRRRHRRFHRGRGGCDAVRHDRRGLAGGAGARRAVGDAIGRCFDTQRPKRRCICRPVWRKLAARPLRVRSPRAVVMAAFDFPFGYPRGSPGTSRDRTIRWSCGWPRASRIPRGREQSPGR